MFFSGPQRKKVAKNVPQSTRSELIEADKIYKENSSINKANFLEVTLL